MADKRRRERPAAEAPKVTPTDKPTLGESDSSKSEPINFQWVGVALIVVGLLVVLSLYFTPSKVREMIYAAKTSTSAQVQPSQKVQVEVPAILESPLYPKWGYIIVDPGQVAVIGIPEHTDMCLSERPIGGGKGRPIDTPGLAYQVDETGAPGHIQEGALQYLRAEQPT
jgi:hypothetical protein